RLLILHRAVQVRAYRREGAPLGFAGPHQQHRKAAEFHDLAAVRLEVLDLSGGSLVHRSLRNVRWGHESDGRVNERGQRSEETTPQKPAQQVAARLFHYDIRPSATYLPKSVTS